MPRVYTRRFDHDEAVRLRAAGHSYSELAERFGVTTTAIEFACKPEMRARNIEAKRQARTGTCETCGGPAMRLVGAKAAHNPDGRTLCHRCRSIERRESVRFDEDWTLVAVRCDLVDCANGERWQPLGNFPRGQRYPDLREGGFHGLCRACNTRMRARSRARRSVPCDRCGEPCMHPAERRRADRNLCQACYRETEAGRTPKLVSLEAVSPHKERAS